MPRQRVASPRVSGLEGTTAQQPEGNAPETPKRAQRIFGEQTPLTTENNRVAIVGMAAVTVAAGIWARLITRVAPEPYLVSSFGAEDKSEY